MQLQLSMGVADKLHEALLVRGEPLEVVEAVRLLTATPCCPTALGLHVVSALTQHDHRFYVSSDGRVSLRNWEVPDPDLADVPFVALDLETTGSRPGQSKITEIGAVRIEGLKEVATFGTLVNPMRPIPPFISQITGITREMVADAPRIEEVIPDLLEFLKGAVIIAHNASFDVTFLNYELRRVKGRQLGDGAFDTLPLARALAPGLPNYRLGTVAAALGAPVAACHRALADAQACGHVFVTLMGRLQEQGITTLSEARAYAAPSLRSNVEKLRLTKDMPRSPGAYHFLDKDGNILYVGKAELLRDRVRSYFVASANPARKVRQAIRQVESIAWTETYTPLEAVTMEQELILEHRPPCNVYGGRPENYTYIKVANSKTGLHLYTTSREPKSADGSAARSERLLSPGETITDSLLIGPFRGRGRLATSLELLQRIYRLRRCPRRSEGRPCVRGETSRCLAPCNGDEEAMLRHDETIIGIVHWLAGRDDAGIDEPQQLVETLERQLASQRRFEEAQKIRDAWEDLQTIRRSYASLVEASNLCFAALWPLDDDGAGAGEDPQIRMNLVWRGRLLHQVSLTESEIQPAIGRLVSGLDPAADAAGGSRLIAVPQTELDSLLAVKYWYNEEPAPAIIQLPTDECAPEPIRLWEETLTAEALDLIRLLKNDVSPRESDEYAR